MDITTIKVQFGGKSEPRDGKLIKLLKDAFRGKLLVRTALIKTEGIKPISGFEPKISKEYRDYFEKLEEQGTPPPLYVYPDEEGSFTMSDDYRTYRLYQERGYSEVMCILLGDSTSDFILEKSEPFQLPIPDSIGVLQK